MTGDFRNWVARLFQSKTAARAANRRTRPRFRVESLEDRVVPATTITIQEAAGTLDGFLSATDGTIAASDLAGVPGTISRTALESVGPGVPISITAENSIIFDATLTTLSLPTDATTSAQFVATNGSITFGNPSNSLTTAGGDLTLTAFAGVPSLFVGNLATAGGDVTLVGDVIELNGAVNAGTGIVAVRPVTAGVDVTLGTEVGGTMSLTGAELGGITAGVLRVGVATTGDISVTAAITLGAAVPTLSLSTGDTITDAAAGSLAVAALRASGTDGVTLDSATHDVNTLAITTGNSLSPAVFTDADDLTIGLVDNTAGVFSNGGDITLTTGGALTINNSVQSGGASLVTLNAGGAATQAVGANVVGQRLLLLGAGPYTLTNPGNLAFVFAANTTGAITYVDGLSLTVASVAGTNGVVSNNNPISLSTVNADLVVADSRAGADVDAGTSTVALTAGGVAGQNRLLRLDANAGVTGTGGVTLTADNMQIAAQVNAGIQTALVRPFEAGTQIDLGGAGSPGVLGLNDGEIDQLSAGIVRIGNVAAGDISVTSAISPGGTSQLELVTGGRHPRRQWWPRRHYRHPARTDRRHRHRRRRRRHPPRHQRQQRRSQQRHRRHRTGQSDGRLGHRGRGERHLERPDRHYVGTRRLHEQQYHQRR